MIHYWKEGATVGVTMGGEDWVDASGRPSDTCFRSSGLNERHSSGIFRGIGDIPGMSEVTVPLVDGYQIK